MTRRGPVSVVVALLAAGCLVTGGDEESEVAVWDLRETHAVEAVGWPEDAGSAWEATTGGGDVERILLAGDVEIEGSFRANPARDGGLRGRPYDDEMSSLVVTFQEEPVDAVLGRAERYAARMGVGLGGLPDWARANADGATTAPGGATALSGSTTLEDGAEVQLETRAFHDEGGVLRVIVTWPRGDDA